MLASVPLLGESMAKKASESSPDGAASSETVRLSSELVEMLRDIIYHARKPDGKRYKMIELADELFRSAITRKHREVVPKQKNEENAP